MDVTNTALLRFLNENCAHLFNKLIDLRRRVEDWLSYIPATFPHYTRHTVRHSDEIINQLSMIIFDEKGLNPSVSMLSCMEAYILGVCAYLHDAGMVAS